MAYTTIDLSTAVLYDGAVYSAGTITHPSGFGYFQIPSVVLDPTKTYRFQVDYTGATSTSLLAAYTQLSADLDGYNNSAWEDLYNEAPASFPDGAGQRTFTMGPALGVVWYETVYTAGEHYIIWEFRSPTVITGMRWEEIPGPALPPDAVGGSDLWSGAGLLYLGVTSVATPQATLTHTPDEPELPGPDAWLGAGAPRTAWWKLQPLDAPTWVNLGGGFTYTGHLEVYWKSPSQGWVRKITTALQEYGFKANAGQEYYVRVNALASDTTSDLTAALEVRTTPPNLQFESISFPAETAPLMSATMATAPLIVAGRSSGGAGSGGARNPAYETSRQERNGGNLYEGWCKFVAEKTGMVSLSATSGGGISVWTDGPTLVGARYNTGTPRLLVDVVQGITYYVRVTRLTNNMSASTSKVAAVAHGYAPMTSMTPLSGTGWTSTIGADTAVMSVSAGTGVQEASLMQFDLGGIAPPSESAGALIGLGYMADCRFVTDAVSNLTPANMIDGLCLSFTSPGGSSLFYWTFDAVWESNVRHEHYISLIDGNGSFVVLEPNVIAGTIPPGLYELTRWLFRRPSDQYTVYLATTRLRASWFVDDAVLDEEPPLVIAAAITRSDRTFVSRS